MNHYFGISSHHHCSSCALNRKDIVHQSILCLCNTSGKCVYYMQSLLHTFNKSPEKKTTAYFIGFKKIQLKPVGFSLNWTFIIFGKNKKSSPLDCSVLHVSTTDQSSSALFLSVESTLLLCKRYINVITNKREKNVIVKHSCIEKFFFVRKRTEG